jgi:hypothetical protein
LRTAFDGIGRELEADLCTVCSGRRLPEVGAVVEGLEDGGRRAEVGSWRLTCVYIFRQEVAGGRSSGGGTRGWWEESGGRELEADFVLYAQAGGCRRSEQWWRDWRTPEGGRRSRAGG